MAKHTNNKLDSSKLESVTNHISPKSEQEASLIIKTTIDKKQKIIPIGGGTLLNLVSKNNNKTISSNYFNKLVFYEPDETVIRVGSGMTIINLLSLLKKNNQTLGFDPPDYKCLNFNNISLNSTIGGIVASGLSGPNSISLGNIRDHLLGCRLINGKGEILKLGSRVIKNVTGFDVTKLMCGSWGSLGLISEVTLKTTVITRKKTTLLIELDSNQSIKLQMQLFGLSSGPTSATWLNSVASKKLLSSKIPILAIRYFGSSRQNKHDINTALSIAKGISKSLKHKMLSSVNEETLWDSIKNLTIYSDTGKELFLWRISLPISKCYGFLKSVPDANNNSILVDCAGTRIWLLTEPNSSMHKNLRKILFEETNNEGQAFILRKPELNLAYENIDTFHSFESNVANLVDRVKHAFDPYDIFTKLN